MVRVIGGYGFSQLLQGPRRRRVVGDVDMQEFSCTEFNHNEGVEHFEGRCHDGQEITSHYSVSVIVDES